MNSRLGFHDSLVALIVDARTPLATHSHRGATPTLSRTLSADLSEPGGYPSRPGRSLTNWKPKRPLMQRWPSVTLESSGDITFTTSASWTTRSSEQPTPQYGQIVLVTVWVDSSQVPSARMSCSDLNISAPVGQTPMQLPQ